MSQEKDGFDHPIAYLSRTLNHAERNYSTMEKECLAALYAMKHFRPYLKSKKFTLQSDNEPLHYMHNRTDPGARLLRWMFKFTDYQYVFKYKAGKLNTNADALSRNPPEEKVNEELPKMMMLTMSKTGAIKKKSKDLGEEQPPRRGDQNKRMETSTSEGEPPPKKRGRPKKVSAPRPAVEAEVKSQEPPRRRRGRPKKTLSPLGIADDAASTASPVNKGEVCHNTRSKAIVLQEPMGTSAKREVLTKKIHKTPVCKARACETDSSELEQVTSESEQDVPVSSDLETEPEPSQEDSEPPLPEVRNSALREETSEDERIVVQQASPKNTAKSIIEMSSVGFDSESEAEKDTVLHCSEMKRIQKH